MCASSPAEPCRMMQRAQMTVQTTNDSQVVVQEAVLPSSNVQVRLLRYKIGGERFQGFDFDRTANNCRVAFSGTATEFLPD